MGGRREQQRARDRGRQEGDVERGAADRVERRERRLERHDQQEAEQRRGAGQRGAQALEDRAEGPIDVRLGRLRDPDRRLGLVVGRCIRLRRHLQSPSAHAAIVGEVPRRAQPDTRTTDTCPISHASSWRTGGRQEVGAARRLPPRSLSRWVDGSGTAGPRHGRIESSWIRESSWTSSRGLIPGRSSCQRGFVCARRRLCVRRRLCGLRGLRGPWDPGHGDGGAGDRHRRHQ